MKEIIKINSIAELHAYFGLAKPKHPLISILRVSDAMDAIEIEKFK